MIDIEELLDYIKMYVDKVTFIKYIISSLPLGQTAYTNIIDNKYEALSILTIEDIDYTINLLGICLKQSADGERQMISLDDELKLIKFLITGVWKTIEQNFDKDKVVELKLLHG